MRRDTKEATAEKNAASHEALKGAIAGAAKVRNRFNAPYFLFSRDNRLDFFR